MIIQLLNSDSETCGLYITGREDFAKTEEAIISAFEIAKENESFYRRHHIEKVHEEPNVHDIADALLETVGIFRKFSESVQTNMI